MVIRTERASGDKGEHGAPQNEVLLSAAELNHILKLQQSIFASVARNVNYRTIIDELCLMAQALLPNSVASVMLKDTGGLLNVLAAPAVPEQGIAALNGLKPGKGGGSCGNAVYTNEPVYVRDTFTDARWSDIRHIAYDFNLCSCWSMPICNEQGEAIGSFALSSFEHRAPSAFHKRLLEIGASIVSVVLARHEQELSLAANRKRLELMGRALSQSTEGVLVTDRDNLIVETNRAFESITGFSAAEVRGANPRLLSSGKHDRTFYQAMWQALAERGRWSGEIINRRRDGQEFTQWMSLSVIRDEVGEIQNYVAVFNDLTELKVGQQKLVRALEFDRLTGLPNKARLNLSLSDGSEAQGLLLVNVDNFSFINTAYGIEFGDRLLCVIAERLAEVVPDAQLYRINADEFGLYFSVLQRSLPDVIETVRQGFFSQQLEVGEQAFNITFTYGAAAGGDGLFGHAVQALRKAKELGRNHHHIYDAVTDEPDQEKRQQAIRWNSVLHRALNEGRVYPYFQGIRDNRSGDMIRYEALVRLEHEGVVYSPHVFLDSARLSGLLPRITREVIARGLAYIAGSDYTLSVNITEEDLSQHYLFDYLQQQTALHGVQPGQVILEILEGVSATGKKNHVAQLAAIKQAGYLLAIDDFGTEYSNFERILELNVDYLKIDAKYIRNIVDDKTSYEVVRAIVFFAKNAGIETVAEFVHSEAVQHVVESLGVEYSQGYLFSEPAASISHGRTYVHSG